MTVIIAKREHGSPLKRITLFSVDSPIIHAAILEYGRSGVITGIERPWIVMKRNAQVGYYQVSKKRLSQYVDEFAVRLNDGKMKRRALERLADFAMPPAGRRIRYARLGA